jgi:hypothetical protein
MREQYGFNSNRNIRRLATGLRTTEIMLAEQLAKLRVYFVSLLVISETAETPAAQNQVNAGQVIQHMVSAEEVIYTDVDIIAIYQDAYRLVYIMLLRLHEIIYNKERILFVILQ